MNGTGIDAFMFFICRTKYVAPVDRGVAEQRVAERLEDALGSDDATAPRACSRNMQRRQVGGVRGRDRFFHLEEERVMVPVAEEQHQVGARADAADADHTVGHVGDAYSVAT